MKKRKLLIILPLLIFILCLCSCSYKSHNSSFCIQFIDVGQGDATFIVTPHNKTILIDGGGSKDFDVGKNTLLPYLLDRGYSSIDYLIPSHFDNDHIGRFTICDARNKSKKYHNRKTI